MSLPAPLKISEQANAICSALNTWAQPRGAKAVVVSNLRDMWEIASQTSQSPSILVCFGGAVARGDYAHVSVWHREDREWLIAVTRGRGFTSVRGDTLSKQVGNAEPFYDSVESLRDLLRCMLGISEETPTPDYISIKPMAMGSMVLDGYLITIKTANDIPGIVLTSPNPPTNDGYAV